MPRGRGWPPNSFGEWMVGQNFLGRLQPPSGGPTPVLKVELSEDEISGDETIAITYPGRRRRHAGAAGKAASASRRVRFEGDRKPLKSAMKKTVSPSESSDTLIDTSDDDDGTTTSSDESSDADESDTSEDEAPIKRRRGKSKKSKVVMCKKETDSESSSANDSLPHPTCRCDDCVKGRKILKAVIKFGAKQSAKGKGKGNKKGKKDEDSSAETSTEATDTTEAGATEPETTGPETTEPETTEPETTEPETTEPETTEPETTEPQTAENETPPEKGKKQKKKQKQKQKQEEKSTENEEHAPEVEEEPKKPVNKNAWKMPTYPKAMQPNWVMPPRTKVMRIEHTIENENDPHPNAFFDSAKGITRVYHGPVFGNHMGELYGRYNADNVKPSGPGWPPIWQQGPRNAPWFLPGPPPGSPFGHNMPAMNFQVPNNEAAMREAASKGLGLSGLPAAPPPPIVSEEVQKAASQKADSGKASKAVPWGATDFNTGGADPGWGGAGFGNDNNNNTWGGGGWGAGGGDSGPKKDGVASPANFGAFGSNNGEKFERHSNKSGSQKNGNGGNWNQGTSWSPAKDNGGGQGNTWGDQGNTWGGDQTKNNNNNGDGGFSWDTAGVNGEKKQSPSGSHAPPPSKPPSPANGTPGKGGGDNSWGGNNQTTGWSPQKNGWGDVGGSGSKKNTPRQHSSFHGAQPDTWGGPPGPKPASRAGSKSGWHGNNNNGNGGPSRRESPKLKGAFGWPAPGHNGYWGQQGGPSQSFWQDTSNQATGPSQSDSWKNPDIAQHTAGKADQW